MYKIKKYLLKTTLKYILIIQLIVLFLVIFLNIIELTRVIENENKNILSFLFLSILKIPYTINETSQFVIIVSTAFLFKYLISNNELISMRNVGFSIFDIFQPIMIGVFVYGLTILILFNPLTSITEIKYDNLLNKKNDDMYSINFSENSLWIKNKNSDDGIHYINIEKFDIKEMHAENIKILSINEKVNELLQSKTGKIEKKSFILHDVNYFNIFYDNYKYEKTLNLELNFSKDNILSSVINFKNIPYYNYISHIKTLK